MELPTLQPATTNQPIIETLCSTYVPMIGSRLSRIVVSIIPLPGSLQKCSLKIRIILQLHFFYSNAETTRLVTNVNNANPDTRRTTMNTAYPARL